MVRISDLDIAYRTFRALELTRSDLLPPGVRAPRGPGHPGLRGGRSRGRRHGPPRRRAGRPMWRWGPPSRRWTSRPTSPRSPWEQLASSRPTMPGSTSCRTTTACFVLEVNGIPGMARAAADDDIGRRRSHRRPPARPRPVLGPRGGPRGGPSMRGSTRPPVALAATLACVLEASAEKVGNVTPTRPFADVGFPDFVDSAAALGPAIAQARPGRVGWAVWKAVAAARRVVPTNTHLGVALLLAPIAAAWSTGQGRRLRTRVAGVLAGLGTDDARWAYRAIRLARPGGLGRSDRADVRRRAGDHPARGDGPRRQSRLHRRRVRPGFRGHVHGGPPRPASGEAPRARACSTPSPTPISS